MRGASVIRAARVEEFTSPGRDASHFFFQAEDGIRDLTVTGVQTCALPISPLAPAPAANRTGPAGTAPARRPAWCRAARTRARRPCPAGAPDRAATRS